MCCMLAAGWMRRQGIVRKGNRVESGKSTEAPDVVLHRRAHLRTATLGTLLKEARPDWSISLFERLNEVAAESS